MGNIFGGNNKVSTGEVVCSTSDQEVNKAGYFPSNFIRTSKYTILTFLPLNLFQQFHRFSNIYFFLVAVCSLVPSATPVTPWSSISPLVIVLAATAIKDGMEDHRRHIEDKKANSAVFQRLSRDGELEEVQSKDILVGDIIYVERGQLIPADLVPLKSSDKDGLCFIETSQLDGESNLKRRTCPEGTMSLSESKLARTNTLFTCEAPNANLYHFTARLEINKGKPVPLSERHFLQRGSMLRNTGFVYGAVVYAGTDTKLFKNLENVLYKVSWLQRTLDRTVFGLFLFKMLLVSIWAILSNVWHSDNKDGHYFYLQWSSSGTEVGALHFLTYFLLGSFIIPISLFVTLEICRVIQSIFMIVDPQMKGMRARNSQIHENLGMIHHIFSDKTGTFTRNEMRLTRLSVGPKTFYEDDSPGESLENAGEHYDDLLEIITAITVCNTVVPEWVQPKDKGQSLSEAESTEMTETTATAQSVSGASLVFQADSPDEVALLECAQANGYTFVQRKAESLIVDTPDEELEYELLATLEFTPERKRMSVIVRLPDGGIRLYSKGADNEMLKRVNDEDDKYDEVSEQVRIFASEGFRTLVFAYKDIDESDFDEWKDRFDEAEASVKGRDEAVAEVCAEMEEELILMGCSAVEDRLQDEVPDTIHYFFRANIKVWLLTGDKQETAINIGYSSRLLEPDFDLVIINDDDSDKVRDRIERAIKDHDADRSVNPFAVVINGTALNHALMDHGELFISLGNLQSCGGVICCRSTPLQKALVVRYAKQYLSSVTLSIGDGSNDVAMIQEADVGVGILGREGSQAARASDYALTEFKHLRPLVSVHGRYSYLRLAGVIQYSFYKNVAFILPQFYFGFYSGFTGQIYYDEWVLAVFNLFMTALPPFMYGFIEKDISRPAIDRYPEAYVRLQSQPLFTRGTFMVWMVNALWHSLVFFFGVMLSGVGTDNYRTDGTTDGLWGQAVLAQQVGIIIVLFKMALYHKQWNILTVFSMSVSICWYFFFMSVYSTMQSFQPSMHLVFFNTMSSGYLWFIFFGLAAIALLPDVAIKYYQGRYYPQDWQILNEMEKFNGGMVRQASDLPDGEAGFGPHTRGGRGGAGGLSKVPSFSADISTASTYYGSTEYSSSGSGTTSSSSSSQGTSSSSSASDSTSLSDTSDSTLSSSLSTSESSS